jgi:Sec-independent protein translocase protein TatA
VQKEWLNFAGDISWPVVALIAVIILGPGGLLKTLFEVVGDKLFKIRSAVEDFNKTAQDFEKTEERLRTSTEAVMELDAKISALAKTLADLRPTIEDISVTLAKQSQTEFADKLHDDAGKVVLADGQGQQTADQMFDIMWGHWNELSELLKSAVGSDKFDGRSIGRTAWILVDGRRSKQLSKEKAELFENLHSQMKRFNRLYSTRDDWLTPDLFRSFLAGVERAKKTLL